MPDRVRIDPPRSENGPHRPLTADPLGEPGRVPELDALRRLAAAAVVLYHSNPKRLPCGWAAVDFFFVLSGYLITTIILRHGGSHGFLLRFYVRRGLRTWPIYFLTVLSVAALGPLLPTPCDYSGLGYELTYTQNLPYYWGAPAPHLSKYLGHTWTLAIEEQFYLVWPALAVAVGRSRLGGVAGALAVASVLARSYQVVPFGLLAGRGDGLLLGALLARLLERDGAPGAISPSLRWLFGLAAAVSAAGLLAIAVTAGMGTPKQPPPWPGLTILAFNGLFFGVVGLTVAGTGHRRLAFLRASRLRGLGAISYGLYLYHFVIIVVAGEVARDLGLRGKPLWREAPTLASCFLAAWLSWRYVEEPFLRLKDRFTYETGVGGRRTSPEPAAQAE